MHNMWTKAHPFFQKFGESDKYGEAAAWLQLAEYQANTNMLEMVETSYRKVVVYAGPNFSDSSVKQVNHTVDVKEDVYIKTRLSHGVGIRSGSMSLDQMRRTS